MEENVGLVKVIILQGRKMAIRDFTSSDPYVVVTVGNQVSYLQPHLLKCNLSLSLSRVVFLDLPANWTYCP